MFTGSLNGVGFRYMEDLKVQYNINAFVDLISTGRGSKLDSK